MKFTKMTGIGNDYVYVDCFNNPAPADPASTAIAVADRHFGIGSDGLILILPSEVADVRMRMFNADGSESEMCGNGIRCVAKYAYDHSLARVNPIEVETGRGVLTLALDVVEGAVETVTVKMGEPILDVPSIPANPEHLTPAKSKHEYSLAESDDSQPATRSSQLPPAVLVSMGNPHAVFFVDDVEAVDLNELGPLVENHPAFPRRVNAHWVQVLSKGEVVMRTWERGSGITLACGTGACAVAVAGALTGRTDRSVLAHLPGGDLVLEWSRKDNNVYMSGPATEVFTGEWRGDDELQGEQPR
jgi:diaminopimelate epimerase